MTKTMPARGGSANLFGGKHFVIIGGGIIGSTLALELVQKGQKATVLEKETRLGLHQSGRNSGVIHSGINQTPGSLKAKMCVEGSRRLRQYCRERAIPMVECGTLVLARNDDEIKILEELLKRGNECGVPGLQLISEKELRKKEPVSKGIAALFSPTGAAIDSLKFLQTVASEAKEKGAQFHLYHKVTGIDKKIVHTSKEEFSADYIVNCAGLEADKIAQMMGVGMGCRIVPFRGEYMEVKNCPVNTMIYQPPDLRFPFLSIHLTRETDGRVLAGPTATLAFGREAYNKEWDFREMSEMFLSRPFQKLILSKEFLGLAYSNFKVSVSRKAFWKEIDSLVTGVKLDQITPHRSGIRAQMVDSDGKLVNDILVEKGEDSTHVLNAVSPGLTSSLAFAEYLAANFLEN